MAPDPASRGTSRAGVPLQFPSQTVAVSTLLRLRSICGTADRARTDGGDGIGSGVQQQYGMTVGTPGSSQINALGTLNIRGERSVVCKGHPDRHPSQGALPPARPRCARSSGQPDALEPRGARRAVRKIPYLTAMPMHCIPFSFKDPFDTKDMRSTAAADARYDIDFPARDHTLVAQLRRTGAIIYAKAVNTEYNGIPADPGGGTSPRRSSSPTSGISAAAGQATRTAATTRPARRCSARSSGSGASVSANLLMWSVCEETTCRVASANHSPWRCCSA